MSFKPDTILKRKAPIEGDIYNEVRVVGPSPVQTQANAAEWGNTPAGHVLSVQPSEFGAVRDVAVGNLQRDYEVVQLPEEFPEIAEPVVTRAVTGPSPEEVFAAEAPPRPEPQPAPVGAPTPEEALGNEGARPSMTQDAAIEADYKRRTSTR